MTRRSPGLPDVQGDLRAHEAGLTRGSAVARRDHRLAASQSERLDRQFLHDLGAVGTRGLDAGMAGVRGIRSASRMSGTMSGRNSVAGLELGLALGPVADVDELLASGARRVEAVGRRSCRPPTLTFFTEDFATSTHSPTSSRRATSLYTMPAAGKPEPVTTDVPTPRRRPRSRQGGDLVLVEVARHGDARVHGTEVVELRADVGDDRRQVAGVDADRAELGATRRAPRSRRRSRCRRCRRAASCRPHRLDLGAERRLLAVVQERERVGSHGGAQAGPLRPASRLLVASNPAMYAARAAATAERSLVRREPISAIGRPSATETMRAAALATEES